MVLSALLFLIAAYAFAETGFTRYTTWSTSGGNAGTGGPHKNYSLNTQKCQVCHSVHSAPGVPTAAPNQWSDTWAITDNPELLLRSTVANACTYCHVQTNIGGVQIYNGDAGRYTIEDPFGHNANAATGCSDCHSVHGADTFAGAVVGKVLRANGGTIANTAGNVQSELASYYASIGVANVFNSPNRDAQISAFCSRCHKTFSSGSDQDITASGNMWSDAVVDLGAETYSNHPMKGAGATFNVAAASYKGRVAWDDATYCRSCHGAGNVKQAAADGGAGGVQLSSFPHHTPNQAMFLLSGWGSGDPLDKDSNLTAGHTVMDATQDGVCLRCHTNGVVGPSGNATAGTGINY